MPAQTLISQFSKNDLFAVLPSGLLLFFAVYVPYAAWVRQANSLWSICRTLTDNVHQNPVSAVFIIFAAYLLGSLLRAIPVGWAERTIPSWNKTSPLWKSITPSWNETKDSPFPYSEALHKVVDTLNENVEATKHDKSKVPILGKKVEHDVFNYWKDVLCLGNPNGFEYYLTFETRTRFFAGMVWAGWAGLLSSIFLLITHPVLHSSSGLPMLVISLSLLSTFGANFRRVRRQEAKALITIFIAHLQMEHSKLPAGTATAASGNPAEQGLKEAREQQRQAQLQAAEHKPTDDWSSEEAIGMWRDRAEMNDSTAWVRQLRESERSK